MWEDVIREVWETEQRFERDCLWRACGVCDERCSVSGKQITGGESEKVRNNRITQSVKVLHIALPDSGSGPFGSHPPLTSQYKGFFFSFFLKRVNRPSEGKIEEQTESLGQIGADSRDKTDKLKIRKCVRGRRYD